MTSEEQPIPVEKNASERLDEIAALAVATEADFRVGSELKSALALGLGESMVALLYPHSIASAAQLVYQLEQAGFRWRLLGAENGSLLDSGQDFVGISLRLLDERLVIEDGKMRVHAGYSLAALVQAAAENGLSGLEGLAGLTGSVGGALRNVTGLIGRYIWSVVEEVVIADRGGLEVIALHDAEERELFDTQDLILGATLKLAPSTAESVLQETERARNARYAAALYQRPATGNLRVVPESVPEAETAEIVREPYAAQAEESIEYVPVESSHAAESAAAVETAAEPVAAQSDNAFAQVQFSDEPNEDWFGLSKMIRERVERELYAQFERIQQMPKSATGKLQESDEGDALVGKFE